MRSSTTGAESVLKSLKKSGMVLFLVIGPIAILVTGMYLTWNWLIDWRDLMLLGVLYIPVGFGVTVGFHRYLTHDAFKANRIVKYVIVILGTMAWQGAPLSWVVNHRVHHAYPDQPGDVHSPHLSKNAIRGFFHSHMGWLFSETNADVQRWGKDLLNDKDIMFINRTTLVWYIASLVIPFLIGGWSGLFWAGFVRILLVQHVTFAVNSICHIFGDRSFETKDRSTNNWVVGLLGMGEGGHNTHHASPRSARHGINWWHFDSSWKMIRLLERFGLAWDIYDLDPDDLVEAIANRASGIKAGIRKDLRVSAG